jgi:hypothetical protein
MESSHLSKKSLHFIRKIDIINKMAKKGKRKNVYFRQTQKEFRAQKITQIFQHFRTNIPHTIYDYSLKGVKYPIEKIRNVYTSFNKKLPKYAKKGK